MRKPISVVVICVLSLLLVQGLVHGQEPSPVNRVGFLGANLSLFEEFRTALANLGFVAGRNVELKRSWPDENRLERLEESAAQLVDWKADLIAAIGATATRASLSFLIYSSGEVKLLIIMYKINGF